MPATPDRQYADQLAILELYLAGTTSYEHLVDWSPVLPEASDVRSSSARVKWQIFTLAISCLSDQSPAGNLKAWIELATRLIIIVPEYGGDADLRQLRNKLNHLPCYDMGHRLAHDDLRERIGSRRP